MRSCGIGWLILVGVDLRARKRQRALEALERLQHALWPIARCVEIGDRRAVGGDLFGALVAEQAAPRQLPRRRLRYPCRPARVRWLSVAAPAAMAPTPSSVATIAIVCARANWSRSRCWWPPAMWPASWASTPMISFGVSAVTSAPVLMKMRRPATKALKRRSLTRTMLMPRLRQARRLAGSAAHSRAPAPRFRRRARSARSGRARRPAAATETAAPAATAAADRLAQRIVAARSIKHGSWSSALVDERGGGEKAAGQYLNL